MARLIILHPRIIARNYTAITFSTHWTRFIVRRTHRGASRPGRWPLPREPEVTRFEAWDALQARRDRSASGDHLQAGDAMKAFCVRWCAARSRLALASPRSRRTTPPTSGCALPSRREGPAALAVLEAWRVRTTCAVC